MRVKWLERLEFCAIFVQEELYGLILLLEIFIIAAFNICNVLCIYMENPFRLGGDIVLDGSSPHSLSVTHQHHVQAVTAASHPPPALTQSPRHFSFHHSLHSPSSCSTACLMFLSHLLLSKSCHKLGLPFSLLHVQCDM